MKEEYLNEHMETMPPGELRALEEQKFLKQLDYVWQGSSFYQDKFRGHGVERGDIRTLDDLSKLPFTKKDEL